VRVLESIFIRHMTLFKLHWCSKLGNIIKKANKYTCRCKVPKLTFLWRLKLQVYSYLKTFIFGYFYVNRAGENLLARCISLIKISFSFFIIYVLGVAARGIWFFPDLCHPTYPAGPSLTHQHRKKYMTKICDPVKDGIEHVYLLYIYTLYIGHK